MGLYSFYIVLRFGHGDNGNFEVILKQKIAHHMVKLGAFSPVCICNIYGLEKAHNNDCQK